MKSRLKNLQTRVVLVIAILTIVSPLTRAAAQGTGSGNDLVIAFINTHTYYEAWKMH